MSGRKISDQNRADFEWAWNESGMTTHEIGELFGISFGRVSQMARSLGLPERHKRPRPFCQGAVDDYKAGMVTADICAKWGISINSLNQDVEQAGIEFRAGGRPKKSTTCRGGGGQCIDF